MYIKSRRRLPYLYSPSMGSVNKADRKQQGLRRELKRSCAQVTDQAEEIKREKKKKRKKRKKKRARIEEGGGKVK